MTNTQPTKRGRPIKPEQDRYTQRVEIRMTRQQLERLKCLGGAVWVRSRIDRAPVKTSE